MEKKAIISAVIITKNEERNIARCLDSIVDIIDEIIVIDSYSTDRTEEICSRFSVRFIQSEWKGYSETKNYGNSLAKGEYILSLDADECISPVLREELLNFKSQFEKSEAYQFSRLTNFCGRWIHHCGWYPDRKVRLWKNGSGKWEGTIHEKLILDPSILPVRLKGDLLHYSYHTLNDYLLQMVHYTEISARENLAKGRNYSILRMVFNPPVKFLNRYILKAGFLDGLSGLIICCMAATGTFLKFARTRQLFNEEKKKKLDVPVDQSK
jgi:glycosyltransferase involved in cell wall biosynthesis